MPRDIDSGNCVGHKAGLDAEWGGEVKKNPLLPRNKPVFQCETTCWFRYQRKLQGTKWIEVPEFCYWSFHSHSFSWRGNICSHSSPQTYSCFGQHTTVSNSYLSWCTLRVKYHQKTLNFSCIFLIIAHVQKTLIFNTMNVLHK